MPSLFTAVTAEWRQLATKWLTQHAQERALSLAQAMARREHLYGEFIGGESDDLVG